ncbi:aldehyde ferredoxin oxidoreductase C-terminal domain-containing protein, partial [Chloroflexota bacterium]
LAAISLALVDKIGSLGKGGLPAIMGSKNLKAIAVTGTKKVPIADPKRFVKICGEIVKKYTDDPTRLPYVKLGKMWFGKEYSLHAANPYKNFTENFSGDKYQELYGTEVYLNTIKGKRLGCTTCMYPCKDLMTVQKGEYEGLTTYLSSMTGRLRNLGIQCSAGCSFGELVKLVDLTNRYGIDTQSFAPTMMLAVELYERGIITKKDTEGLALKADFETTVALLKKVAFRQGIGEVLADGSTGIVKRFGKEFEKYSFHIKGLPQQIDARLFNFNMMSFCQLTNPEGGSIEPAHVGLNWYPRKKGFSLNTVREFAQRMDLPKEAIDKVFDTPSGSGFNISGLMKVAEDFYMVLNSLGVCEYRTEFWDWNIFAEVYSSATGIEMTGNDMKKAGERTWNLFKAINVREGSSDRKDDSWPQRWLEPLPTANGEEIIPMTCGGEVATAEVLNRLLDEYYDDRGWDIKKGIPTRENLVELSLADIAADLQNLRIWDRD